ncbi:non-ribosomal peptide synthetase [Streptomyces sp. NPDC047971]|uniref:non-ribosomal peptide synthetase n=1 Tax=Streptomyces sp. NPDC047971 TaxID=3154499 RepID=UPI0033F9F446
MTGGLLHDLVRGPEETGPAAPALVSADGEISYGALWQRVAVTAELLTERGVRPGDAVGLFFFRSADYVTSLLATLAVGAVAVPLDPEYPAERVGHMLAATDPRLVLRGSGGRHPDETLRPERWAAVGDLPGAGTELRSRPALGPERTTTAAQEQPALVLFTSGSTGTPKGVRLHHGGLVNRLEWGLRQYRFDADDRVLHKASIAFDASLHEIFSPLMAGGTLVIAPPGTQYDSLGLVRLMQDQEVTCAHFVPSMLRYVLDEPELQDCLDLRLLFCGGEALDMELVRRLRRALPECAVFNQYGPTETSVNVSYWDTREAYAGGTAPIGRAVDGAELHVRTADMAPVADGEIGELWVGGLPLALGYLDEAQTSERFRPDPHGPPGTRLYRTGDLVRLAPAGHLEYHGRADDQVKIRGIRVEPGEVASTLRAHPAVRDAVVTAVSGGPTGPRLVAHVVPSDPRTGPETAAAVRAHAATALPPAMRPEQVVVLDRLPRLPNGKVNRHDLPAPPDPHTGPTPAAPAGATTEDRLRDIWREALGVDTVRDEDDFLALGGHSLVALRVSTRVRETAGIEVAPSSCLRVPTFGDWLAEVSRPVGV